jgi:hypothetical protein
MKHEVCVPLHRYLKHSHTRIYIEKSQLTESAWSYILGLLMTVLFVRLLCEIWGPGSSVGIATGYGLDGPGIESRWGARFSARVQTDPGAHPAYCTMDTGSFLAVESGRGVTLTPNPLLVPRSKNRVKLYLYSPWGSSWPVKRVKPTYMWDLTKYEILSLCLCPQIFWIFACLV